MLVIVSFCRLRLPGYAITRLCVCVSMSVSVQVITEVSNNSIKCDMMVQLMTLLTEETRHFKSHFGSATPDVEMKETEHSKKYHDELLGQHEQEGQGEAGGNFDDISIRDLDDAKIEVHLQAVFPLPSTILSVVFALDFLWVLLAVSVSVSSLHAINHRHIALSPCQSIPAANVYTWLQSPRRHDLPICIFFQKDETSFFKKCRDRT